MGRMRSPEFAATRPLYREASATGSGAAERGCQAMHATKIAVKIRSLAKVLRKKVNVGG